MRTTVRPAPHTYGILVGEYERPWDACTPPAPEKTPVYICLHTHTVAQRAGPCFESLDCKRACRSMLVSRTTAFTGEVPALLPRRSPTQLPGGNRRMFPRGGRWRPWRWPWRWSISVGGNTCQMTSPHARLRQLSRLYNLVDCRNGCAVESTTLSCRLWCLGAAQMHSSGGAAAVGRTDEGLVGEPCQLTVNLQSNAFITHWAVRRLSADEGERCDISPCRKCRLPSNTMALITSGAAAVGR